MRHFLTFGFVILVLGCAKEKEMEVTEPEWGYQCNIIGDTLYASSIMVSGTADSTRCLFYIDDKLKQEGERGFFKCALVEGDSLLIYKSYAFFGNHTWVDVDTSSFIYYQPEKIIVNIGD